MNEREFNRDLEYAWDELVLDRTISRYIEAKERNFVKLAMKSVDMDYEAGIALSLMYLGRILDVNGEYDEACRFYQKSKNMFWNMKNNRAIPAQEYLRECHKAGATLSREQIEQIALQDTPRSLMEEFFKRNENQMRTSQLRATSLRSAPGF